MITKIMIVDDNEDIRFSVKEGLESLNKGYEVIGVESGEKCLEILASIKPKIILMDIMMPGMDGLDTSIKIKETPEFEEVPIIFLSAKTDKLSKGTAGVIGDQFLEKPCDTKEIDKAITNALNQNEHT